jgi:hypothetical protein
MFTGIDFIVIALVGLALMYASGSGSGEFKVDFDPLTFLVVAGVALMIILTVL